MVSPHFKLVEVNVEMIQGIHLMLNWLKDFVSAQKEYLQRIVSDDRKRVVLDPDFTGVFVLETNVPYSDFIQNEYFLQL